MAKKKWQVIKNTTAQHVDGVEVGREKFYFKRNGTFILDDPQLARDIDKVYGRKGNQQVAVVPYNGHAIDYTRTFGALISPQARANYDRIFGKRVKHAAK